MLGKIEKKYRIIGGKPLHGEVSISGSKNASLPILAATLLSDQSIQLNNLPNVSDIDDMLVCLYALGKKIKETSKNTVQLTQEPVDEISIPETNARKIRGSILLLGPLIARFSKVILPLPGGCNIGKRPIDLHIKALTALGVDILETEEALICTRKSARLQANTIHFSSKTVTGTENAIMAAVLAEGTSIIHNAAMEPEISDLIQFLNQLGARITGGGTETIVIEGVEKLHGCDGYGIMADRIEAGTYLVAAAITKGSVRLNGVNQEHLTAALDVLRCAGAKIECSADTILIDMTMGPKQSIQLTTQPYPGFPTDLQSPFLSLATLLPGQSFLSETLFENRFLMVQELQKMGALISVNSNTAIVNGCDHLHGAQVEATDLRSGAALVCASLAAKGVTHVNGIRFIERGYEGMIEKLQILGAQIELMSAEQSNLVSLGHFSVKTLQVQGYQEHPTPSV